MFEFNLNLRFELLYALETLSNPGSRIHHEWRQSVDLDWGGLAGAPHLWPMVADVPTTLPPTEDFEALLAALRESDWQVSLLEGALHDPALARRLAARELTLKKALARVRAEKREWLAYVDLYPYREGSPMIGCLERLLRDPEEFCAEVLTFLRRFWETTFAAVWVTLRPQLQRSLEEKERLFLSVTLKEFLEQALLRVELDERREVLRAVRGGYELPLAQIERAYFSPSAFNDRRYWCAYEDRIVFFPYFDPSLSLSSRVFGPLEPELDPALIFAALGDSTRYAIASLLAAQPRRGSDLARALELSRPTVSHHLARLRQAGLVEERYQCGSVTLSLKRSVIEALTQITLAALYGHRREKP